VVVGGPAGVAGVVVMVFGVEVINISDITIAGVAEGGMIVCGGCHDGAIVVPQIVAQCSGMQT